MVSWHGWREELHVGFLRGRKSEITAGLPRVNMLSGGAQWWVHVPGWPCIGSKGYSWTSCGFEWYKCLFMFNKHLFVTEVLIQWEIWTRATHGAITSKNLKETIALPHCTCMCTEVKSNVSFNDTILPRLSPLLFRFVKLSYQGQTR